MPPPSMISNGGVRRAAALAGVAGVLMMASPVMAQQDAVIVIDLPAQELSESLLQLSRAARIEIGFSSDMLAGLRAPALTGRYVPQDAIRLLLRDTGLTAEFIAPDVIVIGAAPSWAGEHSVAPDTAESVIAPLRSPAAAPGRMAPDALTAASSPDRVVVTGSRVARNINETTTPVRAVNLEELRAAEPMSLAEALNFLPEFQNSERPQTTGINTLGNTGQSFLNLRSIGAERTLVLLDGRRIVPSNSRGVVDLSLLPESVIDRVEVVTGGASAAYGSDAVAGVVNFILNRRFTGLEMEALYGVSERGDARTMRTALTGGTMLFGGRGHVMGALNFYENDGVRNYLNRDWFQSCSRIVNPASPPDNIVACGVVSSHFSRGGLITAGPMAGTQFGPGGAPEPFHYGSLLSSQSMVGGSGEDHGVHFQPLPAADRINGFGRFSYDVTPDMTVFVEGLTAEARSAYHATASWQGFGTAYTIHRDNAFLPAEIAAGMDAAGVNQFSLSRYNYDFGVFQVSSRNRMHRFVAGVNASVGDWMLDAYYKYGENRYRQTVDNNLRINRLYEAADAVFHPVTGEIVCSSGLLFPERNCAPLNLFGEGSPSRAALDYVQGQTWQNTHIKQEVFEVSLSGEPFSTQAGPVGVALGGGYRKESYVQTSDPVSQEVRTFTGGYRGFPSVYVSEAAYHQMGGWERTNPLPAAGAYEVYELFGEASAPLLSRRPLAESLEINGAARHTNYSASGGVTTWKLGATWRPIPDLLMRTSRSRDIRAASLDEMFRGGVQGLDRIIDRTLTPDDPRYQPLVLGRQVGNPGLTPERADTFTLGGVWQPRWMSGLTIGLDFYWIDLRDRIAVLATQTMVDQCAAGAVAMCAYIFRDETGKIVRLERPSLNVGQIRTSGQDFDLRYETAAENLIAGAPGALTFRVMASHIFELKQFLPGLTPVDLAGQIQNGGVPRWTANFSLAYESGPFMVQLQEYVIGSGRIVRSLSPDNLPPEQNRIAAVSYTTLSGRYALKTQGADIELFATINNLFDIAPPRAPGNFFFFGTTPTSSSHYDIIGRRVTIGLRASL